ncbi:MAG TPA: carboxypeptidase-like regulatory domain-containing protein, partial [Gemmatimonadaceae bacterium]|nr:carboxypeptidase-like regulatory domain-containing protein [Gemmatimonadaceae bacterium]
ARTEVAVMLHALAHTLATVEVTGKAPPRARGASTVLGSVVDSAGDPLPGVLLTLVGTGERATTGADGRFLFPELAPGSYLLRARRLGFAPVTVPVQVVKEARQRMAVRMSALGALLDTVHVRAASGFGKNASAWRDFDARLRFQRASHRSTTLSSKDLRALGKTALDAAIRYSPAAVRLGVVPGLPGAPSNIATQFKSGGTGPSIAITAPGSSCILVNGSQPMYEPLDAFHADELQAVEIYAPASDLIPGHPESDLTGTIASRMSVIPACGHLGNHPPYFVVWLKGAK